MSWMKLEPIIQSEVSSFSFLRDFLIILNSGFTNLHSHKLCKRTPFSPHLVQHLLLTDFFSETPLLFDDPVNIGNLISGSSAFPKTSLNIWKFTVYVFAEAWLGEF